MSCTNDKNSRKLPDWETLHADTSSWAEDLQLDFFRKAPPWRKLQIAGELRDGMLLLVECGVRRRGPNLSDEQVRRKMADILLGPELAAKVYGAAN